MHPLDSHSSNRLDRFQISGTEPLWTVEDIANYLRLQPETVRIMARAGRIPAIKVGKVWRFKAREVKEILESRTNPRR